jgi:hypothetical protein
VHWEPGFYAFVAAHPGQADLFVDVISPTGQQLDRIGVHTRQGGISSGGRMRGALQSAGRVVNAYITDNWFCAAQ